MCDTDNVRVALRIRPLSETELERGYQIVVERTPGVQQVVVNRNDTFTFNHVFDVLSTQQEVYNAAVLEMLDCLFRGFNATILAYGQTGSGKTHTMGTAFGGELNEDVGVIPRAMYDIFKRIEEKGQEYDFQVSCSFLELYQEQLYDLLSDKGRENSVVDLREDRNGIIMPGLTAISVTNAIEATECLVRGSSGRAVASTAMNKQSSRSHAIFTLTIQSTEKADIKTVTTSKFHLVDLAGSERTKKTQATGDRFKEGVKINQGLLALGNVISALGAGQGQGFVRYRDSKLTRMLQDSLGGNSVTLMIACVSPADYNVAETLSTLRYADRARQIKNKPVVNQDPHVAEINHLKSIIQKLRLELMSNGGTQTMSSSLSNELNGVVLPAVTSTAVFKNKEHEELLEKYCKLQLQLQATLHDVTENEMRAHIAEAAQEKLRAKTELIKVQVSKLAQQFILDDNREIERAELQKHVASVQEINNLVRGLDEEFERTETELHEHKMSMSSCTLNGHASDDIDDDEKANMKANVCEMMRERSDAYTSKQMDFNAQLQRINRELNLKEDLQQRVLGNMSKLTTLDTLQNMEEKFRECESKINELEMERNELMDKLRHHAKDNVSAKIAEERRRRLQTLEQEITEMKKRNLQQAKLLKVHEKEAVKIKNLCVEIQTMKESKVKLIRAMRQESENFRQWKLSREKELIQLRNIDRKRQNEMARNEALHTKQRNVLKRKCEEAMAINKRLKDVLERQRLAQTQRQKLQTVKDASAAANKIEQLLTCVERELEVIITQIDAEYTLDQLMDDRGIISSRINELRQQQQSNRVLQSADATQAECDLQASAELANLQEELEMRNAQIADLQQKVCATELDARQRSLCDSVQSVAEGRAVLKQLLSTIIELRRDHASRTLEQRNAIEEQRAQRELAEERHNATVKRMRLMQMEHEESLAAREQTYEEKIAVLLRELHSRVLQTTDITPGQQECMRIETEQLDKMDLMRDELEHYKQLVADLQSAVAAKKRKTVKSVKKELQEETEDVLAFMSSSESNYSDNDLDPDWRKTPNVRQRRTKISREISSLTSRRTASEYSANSGNSANLEESFLTAKTAQTTNRTISTLNNLIAGDVSCRCRGKCLTKRCKCNFAGVKCDFGSCKCSKLCQNKKYGHDNINEHDADSKMTNLDEKSDDVSMTNSDSDEDKENKINQQTFIPTETTPKISRISTITFDTPSVKRGFFN